MLQAALLLLGCALSRYLWGIDTTVASVVVGVTSFGVLIYIFIIFAGAASKSCPYQTPGSYAFRYLGPKVLGALRLAASAIASFPSAIASTFRGTTGKSKVIETIKTRVQYPHPRWFIGNITRFSRGMFVEIPRAIAIDAHRFGRAVVRSLAVPPIGLYHLGSIIFGSSASFVHWVHSRLDGTTEQDPNQKTIALDFRCIFWMLQTSLDQAIRLSTLKHLVTMTALIDFNPTLVADCFNVFISCVRVSNRKVVVIQGLEQLATLSATCFLRTFHQLSVMDPTSSVLVDLRQRYKTVFPARTDFRGLPFYHTMDKIRGLVDHPVQWSNYESPTRGHIPVAQHMAEVAQVEYQNSQPPKVPRWILRFTFRALSLNPPPPTTALAIWLSIVAIDLGCEATNARTTTSDGRCVHVLWMAIKLTLDQCTSRASFDPDNSEAQNDD